MKKEFLIFFVSIFLINNIDALRLTLSPSEISFESFLNEESCKKIAVSSDKTITLLIEDKWRVGERTDLLEDYNLNSDDINIHISYPKKITIGDRRVVEVCIKPERAGYYNGVIIFKSADNPVGLGGLIELKVSDSEENYPSNKITGEVINEDLNELGKSSNFKIFLIINTIFLLGLFFILLRTKMFREN